MATVQARFRSLPAAPAAQRAARACAALRPPSAAVPLRLRPILGGWPTPTHRGRRRAAPAPPAAIFDGLKKAAGGGSGGDVSAKYEVLSAGGGYEIRLYDVHPAIECDYVKRPEGIERLARYMDGPSNSEGAAMMATQPLLMRYDSVEGKKKSMQLFVGPRKGPVQTGTAPPPTDPSLRLVVAGGEPVAVAEFAGNVTPSSAAAARAALVAALERDGVRVAEADAGGSFQVGQFGEIFSLAPRKNEMRVRVSLT